MVWIAVAVGGAGLARWAHRRARGGTGRVERPACFGEVAATPLPPPALLATARITVKRISRFLTTSVAVNTTKMKQMMSTIMRLLSRASTMIMTDHRRRKRSRLRRLMVLQVVEDRRPRQTRATRSPRAAPARCRKGSSHQQMPV